jgi:TRAP-type uncharacterized transport system substrate-binding protein
MAGSKVTSTSQSKRRSPPAKTFEARENQLVALAFDLAEKQLREGTASAQVISVFLKEGTVRERLEKEKIVHENELLKAKTESIKSAKDSGELYAKALSAMRMYSGQDEENESDSNNQNEERDDLD